jgi:hypothetical protein
LLFSPFLIAISAGALMACSHGAARQPPGKPPTPVSITREEPGGDAFDPHQAALARLAKEPWGWRDDKRGVFHFPLSDWKTWKRVRFWGLPTFVGFRYGDSHHATAALWVRKVRDHDPPTPEACMQRFEQWAIPIADGYNTRVVRETESRASWNGKDVLVKSMDAEVKSLLSRSTWLAVVGAAVGWPPTACVVYGYAFKADDAEQQAAAARDRYAREAFQQLGRMVDQVPDGID